VVLSIQEILELFEACEMRASPARSINLLRTFRFCNEIDQRNICPTAILLVFGTVRSSEFRSSGEGGVRQGEVHHVNVSMVK
jgi:hypothetical protein